jgi:adenine/guanine phosphoribosyltransferase-like PRPP-binding protein
VKGRVVQNKRFKSLYRGLYAVQLIKVAKKFLTYRELSRMFHCSDTVMCRYYRGFSLPNPEKSEKIISALEYRFGLKGFLTSLPREFDAWSVLANYPILELIGFDASGRFGDTPIDRVVALEGVDALVGAVIAGKLGVPLSVFRGADHVFADVTLNITIGSGENAKRYAIAQSEFRRFEKVLIVDAFMDDAEALEKMVDALASAKVIVVGVYSLISSSKLNIKNIIRKLRVESVVTVEDSYRGNCRVRVGV